jgi:uncharacterized protein
VEFTCNPVKNDLNLQHHGLPLLASRDMFNADMRVREDTRKIYPERRFVGYNILQGRWMVVVFCCPTPMHTHIISFRKANRREIKKFETQGV